MTIIAYRNNAIASDSAVINGYGTIIGSVPKCGARVIDGTAYFFGATGELAQGQKFMAWCKGDGLVNYLQGKDDLPLIAPPADKDHCTGIVCHGKTCHRFEGNNPAIVMDGTFHTLGSGDMYLIGAMEHGADVLDAIKIAMKYDAFSGGRLHHFEMIGDELHDFSETPA